jgi:hypothetical protein
MWIKILKLLSQAFLGEGLSEKKGASVGELPNLTFLQKIST